MVHPHANSRNLSRLPPGSHLKEKPQQAEMANAAPRVEAPSDCLIRSLQTTVSLATTIHALPDRPMGKTPPLAFTALKIQKSEL